MFTTSPRGAEVKHLRCRSNVVEEGLPMSQRWFKPFAMAALALSIASASCDSLPTETPAQQQTQPGAQAPMASVQAGEYSFVQSAPVTGTILNISKVISLSGGSLSLLGHTVTVPPSAVLVPTIFTMEVEKNGRIEVELHALVQSLLGLVDVGGKGFLQPVNLSLSYKSAVGVTDYSRLKIALLNEDGTIAEVLPSVVDTKKQTVSASLPHFSRYAMVTD
jgi:hypothetical protein